MTKIQNDGGITADASTYVNSTAYSRTINNAVRHQYRVLSDEEKAQMQAVKDAGLAFIQLIDGLRTPPLDLEKASGGKLWGHLSKDNSGIDTAIQKAQEAVFWAVWHITGDK